MAKSRSLGAWMMRPALGCLLIPVLLFLAWLGWTIIRVNGAPILDEVRPRMAYYACVSEADELLPHSLKRNRLADVFYHSLGGENYVQAIWLVPMTELALSIRFDRQTINRLYASSAFHGASPGGYDGLGRLLYGAPYCALSSQRRRVVEFVSNPLQELVSSDRAVRQETDRAMEKMALFERRRSEALSRQAR
jgi:hypothetical protein